jgi:hypothetical protein
MITDTSTNDEFKKIIKTYSKYRCLICNNRTANYFGPPILGIGKNTITINNKIPDNVFYINSVK